MKSATKPRRGEVWLVSLNPTVGAEIKKTRPAVVISSDALDHTRALPVKLIAPIRGWRQDLTDLYTMVEILPAPNNGLTKKSMVDGLQIRTVDRSRFRKRLGVLSAQEMELIEIAIALVIELPV